MSVAKIQNLTGQVALLTYQKVGLDEKIPTIVTKIEYHTERKVKAEERYLRCVNKDNYHGLMDPMACAMAITNVEEDIQKWEEVKGTLEAERAELVQKIQTLKTEVYREDVLLAQSTEAAHTLQREQQAALLNRQRQEQEFTEAVTQLHRGRSRPDLRQQEEFTEAVTPLHKGRSDSDLRHAQR